MDAVVIVLPCDDSICREHLSKRQCIEELGVKGNNFKSNEAISKLIGSQSYLNERELRLKHD